MKSFSRGLTKTNVKQDLVCGAARCLGLCFVFFIFGGSGSLLQVQSLPLAAFLAATLGSSVAASLARYCSKHKKLQVVKTFAETKLLGSGPDASTPLPSKMEKRLKRYRTENDGSGCQSNNSCAGYQYDNEAFVFAAAGCGAAGHAGEWRVLLDSPNEREL